MDKATVQRKMMRLQKNLIRSWGEDPPQLEDFVVATIFMAKKEKVDQEKLQTMFEELWDVVPEPER